MSELAIYLVLEDEYHPSCNSSTVLTAFDSKEKATAFCEEKQTWLKQYKKQFQKIDICVEWRVQEVILQRSEESENE